MRAAFKQAMKWTKSIPPGEPAVTIGVGTLRQFVDRLPAGRAVELRGMAALGADLLRGDAAGSEIVGRVGRFRIEFDGAPGPVGGDGPALAGSVAAGGLGQFPG